MERQLERGREAEPVLYRQIIREHWEYIEKRLQQVAPLPHVLKSSDVAWGQNEQSYSKPWTATVIGERLQRAPVHSMAIREQMLAPGARSGKHRHYMEAAFYIVEGEGYEAHDEVKYPWHGGDLMCVPTYCVHQHFNSSSVSPARLFFAIPLVFELLGIDSVEQIELHQKLKLPPGFEAIYSPQGQFLGYRTKDGKELRFGWNQALEKSVRQRQAASEKPEPGNLYEYYTNALVAEWQWRRSVPHVVKSDERSWEDTRTGRLKYLAHPLVRSGLRLFDVFIQEIPPSGRSGKHRHVSEEVHLILEGHGYDVHDGTRWDWQKDDIVFIPVNAAHQHFNSDNHKPARFISFQPRLYEYLGLGGFEHLEDAPDYRP